MRRKFLFVSSKKSAAWPKNEGFTLVEMLIVVALIGFVSVVTFRNLSPRNIRAEQAARIFIADIRLAQSMALAGNQFEAGIAFKTCGYGIHWVDKGKYAVYAGLVATDSSCLTANRNYDGSDRITKEAALLGNFTFESQFPDIFYESPDPTTFIDNDNRSDGKFPIIIVKEGACMPIDISCHITTTIYASGKIDIN